VGWPKHLTFGHNPKVAGSNPAPATQFDRFLCPIGRMPVREGPSRHAWARTSLTPMLSRSGSTPGASGAALRKSAKPCAASRESNTIRARPWLSERSVQYPATKPGSPETCRAGWKEGTGPGSLVLISPQAHQMLRRDRGRSPARYRSTLLKALTGALLAE